ncbi:MAG: ribosomal protein S18-alanine N-acetyltransferase [Defluviitaleaceae bacterium]|nr:ribosomal protein S18-alanine N-acetyltransferase [Defluviitaleaceae bacterium]
MIEVRPFNKSDLDSIYEIELESFSIPWAKDDLHKDAVINKLSIYLVAVYDDKVVGYAGMWHVVTEGHITNIAVSPAYRNMGIGQKLIEGLEIIAREKEMIGITLEVRMNNGAAQKLYMKNGYVVEGIRKNYYADTKEDALIMWKYL